MPSTTHEKDEMQLITDNLLKMSNLKQSDIQKLKTVAKTGDPKAYREALTKLMESANISQANDHVNEVQASVSDIVGAYMRSLENTGTEIQSFEDFTPEEVAMVERANARQKEAEEGLARAQAMKENFITRIFVSKQKSIESSEAELKAAKDAAVKADIDSKKSRESRIATASAEDNYARITKHCEVVCNVIERVIEANQTEIDNSEQAQIAFQEADEVAQIELKRLKQSIAKSEANLLKMKEELQDMGPVEASVQKGKIAELEVSIEKSRSEERDYIAIHNAAERNTTVLLGYRKSLEATNGVMKALQTTIREETKGYIVIFAANVQQMKATSLLRVASNIDQVGKAIVKKSFENTLILMSMAVKDYRRRLLEHPEEMKDLTAVLEKIGVLTEEYKKDNAEYQKRIDLGYSSTPKKARPVEDNGKEE